MLLGAVAMAVAMFVVLSLEKPSGEWDAWSIWNLKARFLFRGGLSIGPTSCPARFRTRIRITRSCCLRSWPCAGRWRARNPTLLRSPSHFCSLWALAGLLISSIGILRGKTQAFLAGILVLTASAFVQLGAMQYADMPMSFWILATLALVCLQDRFPTDPRFTIAAGLTAGFAPWTKNEGWLFLAAFLLGRLIAVLRFDSRAALGPQFLRFAGGALPGLAVAAFFQTPLRAAQCPVSAATGRVASASRSFRTLGDHR